jgi:hypothetical protein
MKCQASGKSKRLGNRPPVPRPTIMGAIKERIEACIEAYIEAHIEESFKIHPYTFTLIEVEEPSPRADYYKLTFDASIGIDSATSLYDSMDSSFFDPPTKEYVYIKTVDSQILYGQVCGQTKDTPDMIWVPHKESATFAAAGATTIDEPPELMMHLLIDRIHEIINGARK